MVSSLIQYIQTTVDLNEQEISTILPLLSVRQIKKGCFLVKENEVCDCIAYVNEGFFRIYINGEFKEVTIHLSGPGEFISAFSSFISRLPNLENVQAVCNSEIVFISYKHLQFLYNAYPNLERLGRLMLEKHFVRKESRVISLITDTAEIRYKNLMEEHPEFILNIPLQYIASYLGITPETLSRIRAKDIS